MRYAKAFRWEQLACFLAATLAGGCGDRPGGDSPRASSRVPRVSPWFEDITTRAGVRFVHQVETSGRYLFSESIGSGAAFLDFDNDGRLDLFLFHNVNPAYGQMRNAEREARNTLYHQQPDGSFKDISAGSGLDVAGYGNGVAVGDINNDGFPEILITEYDRVRLFLNLGREGEAPAEPKTPDGSALKFGFGRSLTLPRRFVDITAAAGITNWHWSVPAAFFDYNRDGWLDLVIGNYLDFDPTQKCPDARGQLDFCGPHGFRPTLTRLFRNLGTRNTERGTDAGQQAGGPAGENSSLPAFRPAGLRSAALPHFEDVTLSSGISRAPGKAMQIVCADFDGDRWPDVFITDDGLPNRLFINQRNGKFTEEAVARGLAYTGLGIPAANMGIALGDADGDGWFDVFVPHLAEENHTLWRQGPRGLFHDITARAGLLGMPWHGTGFGAVFADFDCDGALDLAVANGAIRRRAGGAEPSMAPGIAPFWRPYAEPGQLFANAGSGSFREISAANPALCGEAMVGRGLACGDIDNDGAPDLLLIGIAGPARLLRNLTAGSVNGNVTNDSKVINASGLRSHRHWLGLRAVDPALGNRDAYGAELVVQAGSQRWWRLVQPAHSYASSNDPRAHIGLGSNTMVNSIQVRWPDGSEETFAGGPTDRYLTLRRGSGTASSR